MVPSLAHFLFCGECYWRCRAFANALAVRNIDRLQEINATPKATHCVFMAKKLVNAMFE
jgi:hypothetical protein